MIRLLIALMLLVSIPAFAITRDPAQKAAFKKTHPCPANGSRRGACPGYIVDHIKPLCAGGRDAPDNMQWQTKADALAKDKIEWRECRALKVNTTN